MRKLHLPSSRISSAGSPSAITGFSTRSQSLPASGPASLSMCNSTADEEEEVEEVLEELEDETDGGRLNNQPEQSSTSDIGASCLAVQTAALTALRSCIYSMLSLSMPEGNIGSSNPITTVQILNQILQSTYSLSSGPSTRTDLTALTRQLKQVASQQPLLASSDDLVLSQALVTLLASVQSVRDSPIPLPTLAICPTPQDSRQSVGDVGQVATSGQRLEVDSASSAQSSPLSPPTSNPNAGSDRAPDSRTTPEQGAGQNRRRGSITTAASSPAASDELRDPFAAIQHQDEFSILLRRLQTLSGFVPETVRPENGTMMDPNASLASAAKHASEVPSQTDPWSKLKASMHQVRTLSSARKRLSSASGSRTHLFADSPLSPTLHTGLVSAFGKTQTRSRSASRRGSFSSSQSHGNVFDTSSHHPVHHPTGGHDVLATSGSLVGVQSSSSDGRQSAQSIRSSTYSNSGTLAEAPVWLASASAGQGPGALAGAERRNSLGSSTDVASCSAPPKYSMDSLLETDSMGMRSSLDLRKSALPVYSGTAGSQTASQEKLALGAQNAASRSDLADPDSESGKVRKPTLASELDKIENGLERLFALTPQMTDQRAAPRRAVLEEVVHIGQGRSRDKERAVESETADEERAKQATLQEVAAKLSQPGMSRLDDQRASPTKALFSVAGSQSADSDTKAFTTVDAAASASSHSRSLSQRLANAVSFKRPGLSRRKTPPSPLLLQDSSTGAAPKSTSPMLRGSAIGRAAVRREPVYIGTARTAPADDPEALMDALEAVSRAASSSLDDQRVVLKQRSVAAQKPSSTVKPTRHSVDEHDLEVIDQIVQSATRSRFSDQEAEFRPSGSRQARSTTAGVSGTRTDRTHRITHSVPVAIASTFASGDRSKSLGVAAAPARASKTVALTDAGPNQSYSKLRRGSLPFNGRSQGDANDVGQGMGQKDFQGGLSGVGSSSDSLPTAVRAQAASSGWTISPNHNQV